MYEIGMARTQLYNEGHHEIDVAAQYTMAI